MPLILHKDIDNFSKLAVWHIVENVDFFKNKHLIPSYINNPNKKLEFAASRFLINYLTPLFNWSLVSLNLNKKPVYSNDDYFFSISHSYAMAAVIISTKKKVGIDIQQIACNKLDNLKHKFLHTQEIEFLKSVNLKDMPHLLTLSWCIKESIFKYMGVKNLSFKNQIFINWNEFKNESNSVNAQVHLDNKIHQCTIEYIQIENYFLTYLI